MEEGREGEREPQLPLAARAELLPKNSISWMRVACA